MALNHRALVAWLVCAFLWGAAEAVLFFIVADVLLTFIAVRHGLRPALYAAVYAACGALLGGWGLYMWAVHDPEGVLRLMAYLPAVSDEMIDTARAKMQVSPWTAMLAGAFSGVPFKLFVAVAPQADVSSQAIFVMTLPVRLARFVPVVLITAFLAFVCEPVLSRTRQTIVLAAAWVAFYALFWSLMPN